MPSTNNIVFIADFIYYRNMPVKVCNDFITSIRDNCKTYNITIFWTDDNPDEVRSKIQELDPRLIVIFEINNFSLTTKDFGFVLDMTTPVYIFLDDTYYINRSTSTCEYVQRTDGLIFWYKNQKAVTSYQRVFPNKIITNVLSRFVNTRVFCDRKQEKKYDILLYGSRIYNYQYKREKNDAIQDYISVYEKHNNVSVDDDTKISFYPLRVKMLDFLQKYSSRYRIKIVTEACYNSRLCNEELSILINQSYMTIACSSIADVLLHKYLEISASNSVILGNIPSDYRDLFEGNVVEINSFMEDSVILDTIDNALANKETLLEMGQNLHDKVHADHNLQCASDNFTEVMDALIEKKREQ